MSVLSELRKAAKGLIFLSESDASLTAFLWKGVKIPDAATLLQQLQLDPTTPVKEVALAEFFAPMTTPQDGDDDEARVDQARFSALVAQLGALENPRVFRVGAGPELTAYALGTTPDGDTAGVRTQLTET